MNAINCHEELFDAVGVDWDPQDVKRSDSLLSGRVYKSTDCGAWVKLERECLEECGEPLQETWVFVFDLTETKAKLLYGVLAPHGEAYPPESMPRDVVEYALPFDGTIDSSEILALKPVDGEAGSGSRTSYRVQCVVSRKQYRVVAEGVTIGSIVEGSDAEVMPVTLRYPFTRDEWDRAVEDVEMEASMLWDEANGSDDDDE
jgi:hypothetical protein